MGDSKALKSALKEARDLIGQKEFGPALKCCKRILNQDSGHLMALIFSGKCHHEMDQVDMAEKVTFSFGVALDFLASILFLSTVLFESSVCGWRFRLGMAGNGQSLRKEIQRRGGKTKEAHSTLRKAGPITQGILIILLKEFPPIEVFRARYLQVT